MSHGYEAIFDISGVGMDFQRLRMETVALNLANANNTKAVNGKLFQPLVAVAHGDITAPLFDQAAGMPPAGENDQMGVEAEKTSPRLVYEPGHPDANAKGYVQLPGVNPVDEMVSLMTATRAYEANVRVMNAAKRMALKALEIGG